MNYCPECGAENAEGASFCVSCGNRLAHTDSTVSYSPTFIEEELTPVAEQVEAAALIELDQVEGTAGRRMHDVGNEVVTVGRNPDCSIYLDDVTVSREHAEILRGGQGFRIRDAGSLNGTYVNRVRVDAVDLRNGDEIQVGKYRFKFVYT
ncbi:MAG: FHA domain-containing protein [Rubrobacteraceae bacterium]